MKLSHLDDKVISSLLDYPAVVDILRSSFEDLAAGRAQVHPRQRTDSGPFRLSSMGAVWGARKVAGLKVYPTVQGQFSFLITLFDLETNQPLAVLDGAEITKFRTAGITALLANQAARKGSSRLALVGAGFQGRAQVRALCHFFRFEDIAVVDPVVDASWCEQMAQHSGAHVHVCSAEEAVRGADIVVTATRSATPVFDGEWLQAGAFVSAIGTSTPKVRELDDFTLSRAHRIIVEWAPQSLNEAGELVLWKPASEAERSKVVDIPTLCAGTQPWRATEDDIIVAKSVGVGLSDVACAYLAYSNSVKAFQTAALGVAA